MTSSTMTSRSHGCALARYEVMVITHVHVYNHDFFNERKFEVMVTHYLTMTSLKNLPRSHGYACKNSVLTMTSLMSVSVKSWLRTTQP